MTDELLICLFIGFVVGSLVSGRTKENKEQTEIYNKMYKMYQEDIKYYKDLCQWHVQQKEQRNDQKETP